VANVLAGSFAVPAFLTFIIIKTWLGVYNQVFAAGVRPLHIPEQTVQERLRIANFVSAAVQISL